MGFPFERFLLVCEKQVVTSKEAFLFLIALSSPGLVLGVGGAN
jgi:hypothetical protein